MVTTRFYFATKTNLFLGKAYGNQRWLLLGDSIFFVYKIFITNPKKKKKNPIIFMLEIFTADIHNSHTNDQANISRIYVFTSGKFLLLF